MANPGLKLKPAQSVLSPKNWAKFTLPLHKRVITSLVEKYQSDKWVKSTFTEKLLSLYLFIGLAAGKTVSLRLIEIISKSSFAKFFTGLPNGISRSGLSDRNEAIPCNLFRDLVLYLAQQAGKKGKRIIKKAKGEFKIFDSTFISLAHKLIPWSCRSINKGLTSLSLRVNDGSWLPDKVILMNEPGDNVVFEDLIDWMLKGITYIFDRGFATFEVFRKIGESGNFFITRLPRGYVCNVVKRLEIKEAIGNRIKVLKDEIVIIGGKTRENKFTARLITAVNDKKETLYFFTNRFDLKALEICEIYRHRWQIEILFRWLKCQLKINRVISYTENGFYVQIYIALILHLLIIIYRKSQNMAAFSLLEVYRFLQAWVYDFWGYCMFMRGVLFGANLGLGGTEL